MKHLKFIVDKWADGFVASPISIKEVVVGEGDTYEETLSDPRSAVKFHVSTLGYGSYTPTPHFRGFYD